MKLESDLLSDLLKRILQSTSRLFDLLEQESVQLKRQNVTEIVRIAEEKRRLVNQLNSLVSRQEAFLSSRNLFLGRMGIEALLAQNGVELTLANQLEKDWFDIQRLAVSCRRVNEINGAHIELLKHHTQRCRDVLKGGLSEEGTYGQDGSKLYGGQSHSLMKA